MMDNSKSAYLKKYLTLGISTASVVAASTCLAGCGADTTVVEEHNENSTISQEDETSIDRTSKGMTTLYAPPSMTVNDIDVTKNANTSNSNL